MTTGEKIKHFRNLRGISQETLGQLSGINCYDKRCNADTGRTECTGCFDFCPSALDNRSGNSNNSGHSQNPVT